MNVGDIEIVVVSGGELWVDGGNMFGVVPKTLWAHKCPADKDNRVKLETNCLVVRIGNRVGIVDTGYGSKATEKQRERFGMVPGHALITNLAKQDIDPEDVDWVILSHMHFDHVGGCSAHDRDELKPVFPRAQHIIQRAEWEDAVNNPPELAGSYSRDDFGPLESAGLVELVNGDAELFPGISVRLIGGHTRGHQIVLIQAGSEVIAYLADLCPFAAHLKLLWSMAYDQFPLTVRRTKREILPMAVDEQWLVVFGHDPVFRAAHLTVDEKTNVVVDRLLDLNTSRGEHS